MRYTSHLRPVYWVVIRLQKTFFINLNSLEDINVFTSIKSIKLEIESMQSHQKLRIYYGNFSIKRW